MQANERVESSRSQLQPLDQKVINDLVNALMDVIGPPTTKTEWAANEVFGNREIDKLKLICLENPCDPYLAALSCIGSAERSPMVAESALRDAARHAAEVAKRRAETELAASFTKILSEQVY